MKMLYHYSYAGLKGCEIEELMVLDYSTVSMGRKRLRRKMLNNASLQNLVRKIKYNLSLIERFDPVYSSGFFKRALIVQIKVEGEYD